MDDFGLVLDRFELAIFIFLSLFLFLLEIGLVDGDLGVRVFDFVKQTAEYILDFLDIVRVRWEAHIAETLYFHFFFTWYLEVADVVLEGETQVV